MCLKPTPGLKSCNKASSRTARIYEVYYRYGIVRSSIFIPCCLTAFISRLHTFVCLHVSILCQPSGANEQFHSQWQQKTHLSRWSQDGHCGWLRRSQLRAVDGLGASQREIHLLFTVHYADAVQERDANLQMAALVRVCDNLPTVPLAVWVRTMTCEAGGNWPWAKDRLQKRRPLPTTVFEQPRSHSIRKEQAIRTSNKHMCLMYSTSSYTFLFPGT